MKITEKNEAKRQGSTFLDVLFSTFQKNDLPLTDIVPYKKITKEGYLIDSQNEYQAYLKVKTSDLVSMNNTDLNKVISQLTNLVRIYSEPMKVISMTYATETSAQQRYWKGKINQYRRTLLSETLSESEYNRYSLMQKLAVDNLRRIMWVEDNLSELTFFIVVYGKNAKDISVKVRDIVRLGGKSFELKQVNKQKVEDIVFRLNNMNTER
uniref:hypothetical protein n=1 Tax=Carnobacterium sp. TaxID=48221 RepID=UPI00344C70E4